LEGSLSSSISHACGGAGHKEEVGWPIWISVIEMRHKILLM